MAKIVSIVIPNYNGKELLEKNLPTVIKNSPDCEIILVDDASTDDSVKYVMKNYKKIKLIRNQKNLGFAKSVNIGISRANGNYVVLLNTDIVPRKDFIKYSIASFEKQSDLFAVGFMDLSHEGSSIVRRGRGAAAFTKGLFSHFAILPEAGETLWVSGGSGIFDRKKLLELSGFDPVYSPFYWEDIDLSYRAWKKGYTTLFQPKSIVDHFHEEGAIKKTRSAMFVKIISYRNQFIFTWKNISGLSYNMLHILWLPYHFIFAIFRADVAFFLGFMWAILKTPWLLLDYSLQEPLRDDKEILKRFEKLQRSLES